LLASRALKRKYINKKKKIYQLLVYKINLKANFNSKFIKSAYDVETLRTIMHYGAKFSNICKQLFTCDFPQPLQANTGIVPLLDHKWLYKFLQFITF